MHTCAHTVSVDRRPLLVRFHQESQSGGWGEPMAITKACAQRIMRKTSALGGSLLSLQQRVILAQRTLLQSSRPVLGQGNGRKRCTGTDMDSWTRNRAMTEGKRNTCSITWVMEYTPEPWLQGHASPMPFPKSQLFYSSALGPARGLWSRVTSPHTHEMWGNGKVNTPPHWPKVSATNLLQTVTAAGKPRGNPLLGGAVP